MSDLHQVLRDLEAQRQAALEWYDHAIAGVRQLVEANGSPAPNGKRPRSPATSRRGPATAAAPRKDGRASKLDVARGRRMWDAGKSPADIAAALGTSVPTIYSLRYRQDWPKRRGAEKKNGRRKGRPGVMPAPGRRPLLDRSVKCPSCGHETIVDPCAHCNVFLPKTLGGCAPTATIAWATRPPNGWNARAEAPELEEAGA